MENYNLFVVDETKTFSSRLSVQLKEMGASVTVFWAPDVETINEIRVNHNAHAFIISASWQNGNRSIDTEGALVFPLHEVRQDGQEGFGKNDSVTQVAAKIVSKLIGRTQIIGVFGVGGGAGNTTMCMGLAQGFAMNGQRVFVLSIEPFMAFNPFSQLGKTGLAEVLLALDDGADVSKVIERAVVRPQSYGGIDSFYISEYNADRVEFNPGDVAGILDVMRKMNRWDVILVDMESRMDDKLFEVWEAASRMVMMIPHNAIALEKLQYVERDLLLRQKRGEAELDKLVPVVNFAASGNHNVCVFKEPVRHSLRHLRSETIRTMDSRAWCNAFTNDQGYQMIEPILQEVWQQ